MTRTLRCAVDARALEHFVSTAPAAHADARPTHKDGTPYQSEAIAGARWAVHYIVDMTGRRHIVECAAGPAHDVPAGESTFEVDVGGIDLTGVKKSWLKRYFVALNESNNFEVKYYDREPSMEEFEPDCEGKVTPPKETMTTIKRRTPFQGQPEKTGELTVAHKEFVILPRRCPSSSRATSTSTSGRKRAVLAASSPPREGAFD